MRRGLSLIELIFTIVIIAVVFTVIPKIVLSLTKSDSFSIKQDALFNGITMLQMITRLSWDENSVLSNDILQTSSPNFTCNGASQQYRIGGFKGSRNCENNITLLGIGTEELQMAEYDDIDDFHDKNKKTSTYTLLMNVTYINDTIQYTGRHASMVLEDTPSATSTNLKKIDLSMLYSGTKVAKQGETISQFSFTSANIGKFYIGKRTW
jgi:prepilin-type N-terminal cleavage/methylation domain-containing protein